MQGGISAIMSTGCVEGKSLPCPFYDEREALAGLLLARLLAHGDSAGQYFDYQTARGLAERLLRPPSLTYRDIEGICGQGDRRRTRAVLESLGRVGLLFDAGNSVILPERPVSLRVLVGRGRGLEALEPGETPAQVDIDAGLRVLASSRLALELRVYRIAHCVAGEAAPGHVATRRSITRHSLARGRLLTLDLEPLMPAGTEHVEQLLLHASWSSAVQRDEHDSQRADQGDAPVALAAGIVNERESLLASAGPGWVTEYLLPRC